MECSPSRSTWNVKDEHTSVRVKHFFDVDTKSQNLKEIFFRLRYFAEGTGADDWPGWNIRYPK